MENNPVLADVLGFKPSVANILEYLVRNNTTDHPAGEVADAIGLGKSTARTVLSQLSRLGVVRVTRSFGKMNFYTVEASNPIASTLIHLFELMASPVEPYVPVGFTGPAGSPPDDGKQYLGDPAEEPGPIGPTGEGPAKDPDDLLD